MNLLNLLNLKNLFKGIKTKPISHGVYGVLHGTYCGEFLVYMHTMGEYYEFLSLPNKLVRVVPKKDFENGIKNNVIEFAYKLCPRIYNICQKQYLFSKTKNR